MSAVPTRYPILFMRRVFALTFVAALAIGLWSLRDPAPRPANHTGAAPQEIVVTPAPETTPSTTVVITPPGVMAAEARLNPEVTTTTHPPTATTTTNPTPATTPVSPPTTIAKPPTPTTTTTPQRVAGLDTAFASQLVSATNRARANAGLPALKVSGSLTSWAQSWSETMAGDGALGHSNFGSLLGPFSAVAENVARGYPTAAATHDAWMASSGHRTNILNGTYTSIGIGVWIDGNGVSWATQVFGG